METKPQVISEALACLPARRERSVRILSSFPSLHVVFPWHVIISSDAVPPLVPDAGVCEATEGWRGGTQLQTRGSEPEHHKKMHSRKPGTRVGMRHIKNLT